MKVRTLNIQDSSEQQRASYFQYKFWNKMLLLIIKIHCTWWVKH